MVGGGISITARKREPDDLLFDTSRDSPFQGDTLDARPMAANRCAGD